jgi:hypothetical protein
MLGPFILVVWLMGTASQDGVAEFTARVDAYMTLRREVAHGVPAEWIFEDPAEMLAERKALRQAIRDARPDARTGDLFTPRAAVAFRRIVAATAAEQRVDPKDVVRALRAERIPGARPPVVNRPYDWRLGAWMWPALLHALPPLPPDLQYRIVDDDLVLIDLRASLVVDILEDVMTADED